MKDLFVRLDSFTTPVPLDVLQDWIQSVAIRKEDLERFSCFHATHYQQNLVYPGPAYHALLLCWRAGQRSPIHDHTGSSCAVKVLCGVATETRFGRGPNGMIYATDSRTLGGGETCASYDSTEKMGLRSCPIRERIRLP